jgi:hypothetical protein
MSLPIRVTSRPIRVTSRPIRVIMIIRVTSRPIRVIILVNLIRAMSLPIRVHSAILSGRRMTTWLWESTLWLLDLAAHD